MKPLRISESVVPIAQFKSQAPQWLRHVSKSGQPVIITLNGKPAGVLLSPLEFDKLQDRERFLTSIAEGLADADANRVMTSSELRQKLSERHPQVKPQ